MFTKNEISAALGAAYSAAYSLADSAEAVAGLHMRLASYSKETYLTDAHIRQGLTHGLESRAAVLEARQLLRDIEGL